MGESSDGEEESLGEDIMGEEVEVDSDEEMYQNEEEGKTVLKIYIAFVFFVFCIKWFKCY
jgi:hypothetical protein